MQNVDSAPEATEEMARLLDGKPWSQQLNDLKVCMHDLGQILAQRVRLRETVAARENPRRAAEEEYRALGSKDPRPDEGHARKSSDATTGSATFGHRPGCTRAARFTMQGGDCGLERVTAQQGGCPIGPCAMSAPNASAVSHESVLIAYRWPRRRPPSLFVSLAWAGHF